MKIDGSSMVYLEDPTRPLTLKLNTTEGYATAEYSDSFVADRLMINEGRDFMIITSRYIHLQLKTTF